MLSFAQTSQGWYFDDQTNYTTRPTYALDNVKPIFAIEGHNR